MEYVYTAVSACFFIAVERLTVDPETVHSAALRIGNDMNGETPVPEAQIRALTYLTDLIRISSLVGAYPIVGVTCLFLNRKFVHVTLPAKKQNCVQ